MSQLSIQNFSFITKESCHLGEKCLQPFNCKNKSLLYINDGQIEFETKNTVPLTLAIYNEILALNPTTCIQYLYEESYKNLRNKIKEELNK